MGIPASYHAGKVKRTRFAGGVAYPTIKYYIAESDLNAKEIEMGTTAESPDLRFRVYLYSFLRLHSK